MTNIYTYMYIQRREIAQNQRALFEQVHFTRYVKPCVIQICTISSVAVLRGIKSMARMWTISWKNYLLRITAIRADRSCCNTAVSYTKEI
jgi:hypothetical protein